MRMALTGDDYYEAGTLDVLVKAKLQGIQKRLGYMFVATVEHSDLKVFTNAMQLMRGLPLIHLVIPLWKYLYLLVMVG